MCELPFILYKYSYSRNTTSVVPTVSSYQIPNLGSNEKIVMGWTMLYLPAIIFISTLSLGVPRPATSVGTLMLIHAQVSYIFSILFSVSMTHHATLA